MFVLVTNNSGDDYLFKVEGATSEIQARYDAYCEVYVDRDDPTGPQDSTVKEYTQIVTPITIQGTQPED